jgi:flavin reductase (DIM6/NTAB) family NADH-FMN oxidoreductase RutF
VVTAISADGSPVGLTINSLTSVSLDPPLVLWCVQRGSARFRIFARAGHFGVSLLAAHQERLARRFAARHPARFAAWPGPAARTACRCCR